MLSFNSSVTYGNAGSPFGSEILLNISAGPFYLSASSQAQLARVLPCLARITMGDATGAQGTDIQYTPDNGATWRSTKSGTGTLIYVDSGGTIRLFGTHVTGTLNVFFVPMKVGV